MKKIFVLLSVIVLLNLSIFATWSIVAADPDTGEVGSAGASGTPFVWVILGLNPGHGVVAAQADTNEEAKIKAIEMLSGNAAPSDIIKTITAASFDPKFELQQYGIISLDATAGSAGFTGKKNQKYAADLQGNFVSVQGNILSHPDEVQKVLNAYLDASKNKDISFKERLLIALEAGSKAGGDSRCGTQTAYTAYLAVSKPGEKINSASFGIVIKSQEKTGENPVKLLRSEYEKYKNQNHPAVFPTMKENLIIYLLIPLSLGIVLPIFIYKQKMHKIIFASIISPAAFYIIIKLIFDFMNYISIIYGEYEIYTVIILCIISCIITLITASLYKLATQKIRE